MPIGGAGSPYNTLWLGAKSTSIPSGILIHPAVSPQQALAKNLGCPRFGGREGWGVGFPSNTMWPGPRPISLPSGILIHPVVSVWPQYTSVTDKRTDKTRQDRQRDNGPISSGEQFHKRSPKNCKRRCIYTTTSVGQLLTRIHAKNVKKSASAVCTNWMLLIYLFFCNRIASDDVNSLLMTKLHFFAKSSVKPPSLNATAVAIYIPLRLYNIQHVQCLLCYTKVSIRVISLYAGCAPSRRQQI